MAECTGCAKEMGFTDRQNAKSHNGLCQSCTVLAAAHLCRPAIVFGPVDAPPWVLHTLLPCIAAFRHCKPLRFDFAWQRGTSKEPKIIFRGCLIMKIL